MSLRPERSRAATLTALAWANVLTHVAGLVLAAVAMAPGTPLAPLAQQLAYLAASPPGWIAGWACWMLCAVLLVRFLAAIAMRLGTAAPLAWLAVIIAVAGAAFDLFCDSVYIVVLPALAAEPQAVLLFLTVERMIGIGSLVIANGAYSVAILVMSEALHAQCAIGTAATLLGYAVGGFGLLLAAAAFTGFPWHAQWATPPTIGLFCVWVVVVARHLDAAGRP